MKTLKITLASLLIALISFTAAAQPTSYVKIFLAENSNDSAQVHAPLILAFNNQGDHNLAFPDAGNASYFGQYNNRMFPFTNSADGQLISNYDARPECTTYMAIPFGILSKDSGTVKIIAQYATNDTNAILPAFVWIEQISTGEKHSILDSVKLRVGPNINYATDFILHIGPATVNTSTNELCYGSNDGTLHVQGPNAAGFTHELTFNGSPLYNSVVSGFDTLVTGLAPGSYVSVVRINGIPVDSSDVEIYAGATLIADFILDYNTVTEGDTVNFTDYSSGGTTYAWDFGDGHTSTTVGNDFHQYITSGSYTVTLQITDANGCTASNFDYVDVQPIGTGTGGPSSGGHGNDFGGVGTDAPSGVNNAQQFRNTTSFATMNGRITVNNTEESIVHVTIVSMNGTVIVNEQQTESMSAYNVPAAGCYVVSVVNADGSVTSTTLLVQ